MGKVNIVVGTEQIANDLLRERGDIYSSREQLPMGSQLLSDNKKALFLPYGGRSSYSKPLQTCSTDGQQMNGAASASFSTT